MDDDLNAPHTAAHHDFLLNPHRHHN
jgi:hypothetical protein